MQKLLTMFHFLIYTRTVAVGYMQKLLTMFPLFDIYKDCGGWLYAKTADNVPTF